MDSTAVQWYQENVDMRARTLQQAMFVDSVNAPLSHNTGGPYSATSQLQIMVDNSLQSPAPRAHFGEFGAGAHCGQVDSP
jgi:hypothetical protein